MANQTLELTEEEIEEQSTEEIQYLRNIDRSVLDESDSYFDEWPCFQWKYESLNGEPRQVFKKLSD